MEVGSSSSLSPDSVIETLTTRGWCFRDLVEVKAMAMIHLALADDPNSVINSLESELANTDLRSIGAKSLPDFATLRKSSHILGPKVLQISSARDISRSKLQESSGNSGGGRRLLKLNLTDGVSEIAAIEYFHVPSIPDEVVPGTKVRLEMKAPIHNGIVCLNPKVLTLIGGVVPSLYEEWQMNKKYSGSSRSSLRLSNESGGVGPPPFEKFQIGVSRRQVVHQDYARLNSKNGGTSEVTQNPEIKQSAGRDKLRAKEMDNNKKPVSVRERNEEKPSNSETRPKEVVEYVPVQNQEASQKLLHKLSNQNQNERYSRGRRFKGKEREDETSTLTLNEWERRKAEAKPVKGYQHSNISRDEDLARQLQNQFDLEDSNEQMGSQNVKAVDIRMSMFNYGGDSNVGRGTEHEGGRRGRGRGRGKGRGRGRGNFY